MVVYLSVIGGNQKSTAKNKLADKNLCQLFIFTVFKDLPRHVLRFACPKCNSKLCNHPTKTLFSFMENSTA